MSLTANNIVARMITSVVEDFDCLTLLIGTQGISAGNINLRKCIYIREFVIEPVGRKTEGLRLVDDLYSL